MDRPEPTMRINPHRQKSWQHAEPSSLLPHGQWSHRNILQGCHLPPPKNYQNQCDPGKYPQQLSGAAGANKGSASSAPFPLPGVRRLRRPSRCCAEGAKVALRPHCSRRRRVAGAAGARRVCRLRRPPLSRAAAAPREQREHAVRAVPLAAALPPRRGSEGSVTSVQRERRKLAVCAVLVTAVLPEQPERANGALPLHRSCRRRPAGATGARGARHLRRSHCLRAEGAKGAPRPRQSHRRCAA